MGHGGTAILLVGGLVLSVVGCATAPVERQVTFTPKNHMLDNNDNFSADGRFVCYDTREWIGPGIENSQSVEKVEIATGKETVEPCPMCCWAIVTAGIERLVVGVRFADLSNTDVGGYAVEKLLAMTGKSLEIITHIRADECRRLRDTG